MICVELGNGTPPHPISVEAIARKTRNRLIRSVSAGPVNLPSGRTAGLYESATRIGLAQEPLPCPTRWAVFEQNDEPVWRAAARFDATERGSPPGYPYGRS